MTNFEKWKEELINLIANRMALVCGKPVGCFGVSCRNCDFYRKDDNCRERAKEWLLSEYQEPAPKLTRQEREFLECFEFKYDKAISKTAGRTYLRMAVSEHEIHSEEINSNMFPFIKPGKQWTFEDLLKLEVEDNE